MKSIFSFISPRNMLLAITLCCAGIAPSFGQSYVRTYASSINFGSYTPAKPPVDIINATNGGTNAYTCVLQTESTNQYILLKKLDFTGTPVFDVAWQCPGGTTIQPTKLVQTPNGEYMVVGYYDDGLHPKAPFAARFDATGFFKWFKYYPNSKSPINWRTRAGKVVIARVEDDPNYSDTYILAGSIGAPPTSSGYTLVDVNALRIDGNGSVMWDTTYREMIIQAGDNYEINVTTIAYGHSNTSDPKDKYLIGGVVDRSSSSGGLSYLTFYMSIDRNGRIVDHENNFFVPNYPFNVNAIYDFSENRFVLTYTMGNSGLVGSPVVSMAAITKLNYASLSHFVTKYFYIPGVVENYSTGICEDLSQNNYLLSAWEDISPTGNMAVYRIDQATLNLVQIHVFNVFTNTVPLTGIITVQDNSGPPLESHVMAGLGYNSNTLIDDMRIISTDATDNACGGIIPSLTGDGFYSPIIIPVSLSKDTGYSVFKQTLKQFTVLTGYTDCAGAPDPDYYRTATEQVNGTLKIYPTLLDESNNTVTFDAYTEDRTTITLSIYNMEGKKMDTKTFDLDFGANRLSWTLPALLPGSYVISSISGNKDLNKTIRISKL